MTILADTFQEAESLVCHSLTNISISPSDYDISEMVCSDGKTRKLLVSETMTIDDARRNNISLVLQALGLRRYGSMDTRFHYVACYRQHEGPVKETQEGFLRRLLRRFKR